MIVCSRKISSMKKNKYLNFNKTERLVFNNTHGKKITEKHKELVEDWLLDKITLQHLARKIGVARIPVKNGHKGKNAVSTVYILVARTMKKMFKENKLKI